MIQKAPLADCDSCPLVDEPFVRGKGPDDATYAIVGEAPGAEEIKSGVPFIGKAGRLLNRVLENQEIPREAIWITNTVLCRPPGNRTPTAAEVKCCRERLVAEVRSKSPQAVLALGAVSAKALLNTREKITTLRMGGGEHSEEIGARIIPTFHTAAALRDPDKFPSIISDVRKLKRPIVVGWEPTKYTVARDPIQAEDLLRLQARSNLLALDIENDAPFDRHRPRWLCIGISHRPGRAVVYPEETLHAIKEPLAKMFADRGKKWIMQNGKYDVQYLWEFARDARVDEDTMLAHYLCDERKGTHDLEQIATEYLGAPMYKTEAKSTLGKEDEPLSFLDPEVLYRYNATDVDVTYRLLDPLTKEMRSDGVEKPYRELLIPASHALAKMEYAGVRVDLEKLSGMEQELDNELEVLEEGLKEWVENPRSPMQIKDALWKMGYSVPNTTKDVIKDIQHPFTERLLEYKARHKILSTYVRGLKKNIIRGRVNPSFLLHGTESGRTSCRRPNLQNVPVDHPVRECFTADAPDRVLIDADYEQIELRVAAEISGDPWLLEQFHRGENIHKAVATAQFGENYTAREYITAKSISYGSLYGEGAPHLAHRLGISVGEADAMLKAFFKRSPKLLEYRKSIEEQILRQGYIRSPFGRLRRFWLVTYDNKYDVFKEGYNFPIQSAASDVALGALINLTRTFQPARMIVHDSLVFEVGADEVEEASEVIRQGMEEANPFDVPIPVGISYDYRWKVKE